MVKKRENFVMAVIMLALTTLVKFEEPQKYEYKILFLLKKKILFAEIFIVFAGARYNSYDDIK